MQACTQAASPAISAQRHARRLPRIAPAPPQAAISAISGGARCGRFLCRAQQQEPQGAEAEDEAVTFSKFAVGFYCSWGHLPGHN